MYKFLTKNKFVKEDVDKYLLERNNDTDEGLDWDQWNKSNKYKLFKMFVHLDSLIFIF